MTTSLRMLPSLEGHRDELEKCVYCPKLCRASCPVSNAEPKESLIPWGKMSTSYFMARGDLPITPESASVAWACTDCFACRERCDHKNLVGPALNDARADLFAKGAAPPAAQDLARTWKERGDARRGELDRLREGDRKQGGTKLLLGCAYTRRAPVEARLAVRVTEALLGERVTLVDACCGYPLLAAGDCDGFAREGRSLALEVGAAERLVVLDPGCFRAIERDLTATGVEVPRPTLLVDHAFSHLDRFQQKDLPVPRYHDPCQLGRGLGRYEEPRAILERVAGSKPIEFERAKERADCAGSGGLLPLTRPEGSARIASDRIDEHQRLGGGDLVTACGSSLHRFRKSGIAARDLLSYMAIGLGLE